MWNEPFSVESLRRIIDYENRKGVFLEKEFFPDVAALNDEIKEITAQVKELESRMVDPASDEFKVKVEKKAESVKKKEELLNSSLLRISNELLQKNFKIDLNQINGEHKLFVAPRIAQNFFALRQLQYNFQKFYKIKQSSAYMIVSQLIRFLEEDFPKFIIRTDIKDFYESIPHDKILKKIYDDSLIDSHSRQILKKILDEYKRLGETDVGIPRGVGVSAYLAELYMRDFDKKIRGLKNVFYYARYVDDIIVIFNPPSENHLEKIDEIIAQKKLVRNDLKTNIIDHTESRYSSNLEYLGYSIQFGTSDTQIRLSSNKIAKYRKRIDLILEAYRKLSRVDEKKARKILVKRFRFLTGNTRLMNNKKDILVGIYFSNSLINNKSDLLALDQYREQKINEFILFAPLRNRLNRYDFVRGFNEKRFSPFKTHELSEIINAWN